MSGDGGGGNNSGRFMDEVELVSVEMGDVAYLVQAIKCGCV